MAQKDMEAKLKSLEDEVTSLKDIEEIKKLQRIYCYYLEHWQWEEIVELFSDAPDASAELSNFGAYIGKEQIRKLFARPKPPAEFLHIIMPISGVVDMDPDGKTAKGRWYGFGPHAIPHGKEVVATWSCGIYENEFIKERGKWKFKKLLWNRIFITKYEDGWVKNPVATTDPATVQRRTQNPPNRPSTAYKPYPSGYIIPYHYKNPITGK